MTIVPHTKYSLLHQNPLHFKFESAIGMAAGAFYGTLSGGLLGGAIGAGISKEQAKHYSELLAQGNYLVAIEGTETEIDHATSILKTENIRDWITFEKF